MFEKPQEQHRWLEQLVGEWTCEHECPSEPGKPPELFKGTDSVRSIGGLWVVCEGKGAMPGTGEHTNTLMTLGFDPKQNCYVGSFIGSMMTKLWIYEKGVLDATGKQLTLEADGPSFTEEGKTARYRDSIEFKSDTHRTLTSEQRNADGTWTQFMTANYWRK